MTSLSTPNDNAAVCTKYSTTTPTKTTARTRTATKRTAIVFDYDWSLINTNSDTWIFEQCFQKENPNILIDLATKGDISSAGSSSTATSTSEDGCGMQWTKAVDRGLQIIQETKVLSGEQTEDEVIQELCQAVANVPVQDGMLDIINYVASLPYVDLYIISDANTVFINEFLKKHNLLHMFKQVITNYGEIIELEKKDDKEQSSTTTNTTTKEKSVASLSRRLRVRPYYDFDHLPSHGCQWCPPNMCKGSILNNIITNKEKRYYDRGIVYIGDGNGDFCPCLQLSNTSKDLVLAREDPIDDTKYGLIQQIEQYYDTYPIKANVIKWNTGHDINRIIRNYLQQQQHQVEDDDESS